MVLILRPLFVGCVKKRRPNLVICFNPEAAQGPHASLRRNVYNALRPIARRVCQCVRALFCNCGELRYIITVIYVTQESHRGSMYFNK